MTAIVARARCHDLALDHDQRVFLHLSWAQFETLLAMRGDSTGVRVAYRDGCVELMSLSRSHEWIKTTLARLIEAFATERGIECNGYGAWTQTDPALERGLEPDECYIFGGDAAKDRPDLAIEVIWTHGGLDKLAIYRDLRIAEVWVWDDNRIRVLGLTPDGYVERPTSTWLPTLDLVRVCGFLDRDSQTQAVRDFLAWVREGAS